MPLSFRFFGTAGTVNLPMLSADADNDLRWLVGFRRRPPPHSSSMASLWSQQRCSSGSQ